MKAVIRFSYGAKIFDAGQEVEGLTDESLERLKKQGLITEGEGAEKEILSRHGEVELPIVEKVKKAPEPEKKKISKPGTAKK